MLPLLLASGLSQYGIAEDSASLAARLDAAQQISSLEDSSLKPWHLKINVHLFDSKGKPVGDGTIEEWWQSPDHYRREFKTPIYNATDIRDGDKSYRTKDVGSPPYILEELYQQTVNPLARYKSEDPSHAELRKQPFGKLQLECVMLSQPIKRLAQAPLGLFPTYCFEPGKSDFRASLEPGTEAIIRNILGAFQGKHVATKLSIMSETAQVGSSEVVTLETFSPATPPAATLPPDVIEQTSGTVRVASGTMAGRALERPDPVYPVDARMSHITGAVVLHAIIGTDGHIHSLRVVSAPDPSLAVSAIAAVRKWRYSPYLLNGFPVDVETTINVNYSIGN